MQKSCAPAWSLNFHVKSLIALLYMTFVDVNITLIGERKNNWNELKHNFCLKRNPEQQSGEYSMTVLVLMELVLWKCTSYWIYHVSNPHDVFCLYLFILHIIWILALYENLQYDFKRKTTHWNWNWNVQS